MYHIDIMSIHSQAKPDGSHSDVVDVLRKLKQHFNECFPKDVPLYLILSHRFHVTHSLYDCDELKGFITGCIERLETMEPKKVASCISTFLEKYTKLLKNSILVYLSYCDAYS